MQAIGEYVFSLTVICAACAVAQFLLPDKSSVSVYLRFLLALIITVFLLSPLQSVLGLIPDILNCEAEVFTFSEEDYGMVYANEVIKGTIDEIQGVLKGDIEERFSISVSRVSVEYNAGNVENIIIEKVIVRLEEGNRFLVSDIIKYIENLMKCECEVISDAE